MRALAIAVFLGIILSVSGTCAELQVGAGQVYSTISAAVAAAQNSDTITIHQGTYTEGQINVTKSNLTLRGAPGEAMPKLVSTTGMYSNKIVINADGITVRGLEITHQQGTQYGYGIGDGNAGTAHSGWTVENCVIHDCRSAIWNNKASDFTFRNNIVYNNYSKRLYLEATKSFVCTGNFFYGATRTGQRIIEWYPGSGEMSGDTVISGNYMSGGNVQILMDGQGANSPSGTRTVTISHNTLDGTMGAWSQPGDSAAQLIAFWDNSGQTYDPGKIAIRDNLCVNSTWYGLVNTDAAGTGGLASDLTVQNCLFYGNHANGASSYPREWSGTCSTGQVGWSAQGGNFVMSNCVTQDPRLARTGLTAEEYYALMAGSPAYHTASDGTNIGAWQGAVPEPSSLLALGCGLVGLIGFRKRRAS